MFNAALNLALSIRNNAANTLRQQLLCILIHVKLQGIIQDRHHVFHAHNFRAVDLDRCAVAEDARATARKIPTPTTRPSALVRPGGISVCVLINDDSALLAQRLHQH